MNNNFDSGYEIQQNILTKLGGDGTKCFDSQYSILLEILDKIEGGGSVTDVDELPNEYLNKNKIVRYEGNLYYIKPKGINAIQITALSGTPYISVYRKSTSTLVEHSYDGVEWNETNINDTYNLTEGQSIYFRGIVTADSTSDWVSFRCLGEGTVKASGNINTMVNYEADDLGDDFNLTYPGCLRYLFSNSKALVDISELYFPSIHLTSNCYEGMFDSCYNLTGKLPQLPATELTPYCYKNMYTDCMSITDASELILPAKFVSNRGYQNMFSMVNVAPAGKSSQLTKSPIICATNMNEERCAFGMFNNCTNLSEITCLATDILGTKTTDNFSKSVAASGVFHKASSMNDWTIGINGIPEGWTTDDATEPEYKYDWSGLYEWTQIADENGEGGATYTAGQNISIDASNNISAEGYKYYPDIKSTKTIAKMTSTSLINKYSEDGNIIDLPSGKNEGFVFGSRNVLKAGLSTIMGNTNTIESSMSSNFTVGKGNTINGGNTAIAVGFGNTINGDNSNLVSLQYAIGSNLIVNNHTEGALGQYNITHNGNIDAAQTRFSIGDGKYRTVAEGDSIRENIIEVMNNGDIYLRGVGGYDGVHIKTETGYENTKTLQEYIAALEAKLAEYEVATNQEIDNLF